MPKIFIDGKWIYFDWCRLYENNKGIMSAYPILSILCFEFYVKFDRVHRISEIVFWTDFIYKFCSYGNFKDLQSTGITVSMRSYLGVGWPLQRLVIAQRRVSNRTLLNGALKTWNMSCRAPASKIISLNLTLSAARLPRMGIIWSL